MRIGSTIQLEPVIDLCIELDAECFKKSADRRSRFSARRKTQAPETRRNLLGYLTAIAPAIPLGPVAVNAVAHARMNTLPNVALDGVLGISTKGHRRRVDLALALHPQDKAVIGRAAAHDAFLREGLDAGSFAGVPFATSLAGAVFDLPPAIGSLNCG
ncbi:MAG: hypothetical protein JO094_08355 [Hyphomicrobiales bacterium]|nr:hypothetical protein [Hyphomicrobiales bacterium]